MLKIVAYVLKKIVEIEFFGGKKGEFYLLIAQFYNEQKKL